MKKIINVILAAGIASTVSIGMLPAAEIAQATFNADNVVNAPKGYRQWVFVGAPLTPHALNDGAAPFPEFHNVYVEPSAIKNPAASGRGIHCAKT